MVKVREVRPGDAALLAANMRPADVLEVEAVHGPGDLTAAIEEALASSTLSWTAEADGELMCIFGVAPVSLMSDVGVPWLLGTPVVQRNGRALTRLAPTYIARMLTAFPCLANGVDTRNTAAVRWIARMGFELLPPTPVGAARVPFHPFRMAA